MYAHAMLSIPAACLLGYGLWKSGVNSYTVQMYLVADRAMLNPITPYKCVLCVLGSIGWRVVSWKLMFQVLKVFWNFC